MTATSPIVGLVGGIASGKSSVAAALGRLGAKVVDADRIAHEVLARPEIGAELRQRLGEDAIGPDGRPDRKRIGEIVFGDDRKLRALEELIHPSVRERIREIVAGAAGAVAIVLDVPLLLEGGLADLAEVIVFVEAPEAERKRRVRDDRGWTEGEVPRRESRQAPIEEKRRRADHVLRNDGSLELLEERTAELLRVIRSEAERTAEDA